MLSELCTSDSTIFMTQDKNTENEKIVANGEMQMQKNLIDDRRFEGRIRGTQMDDGSLTMTYSAIVTGKDQKKIVRVSFERGAKSGGVERAEAILPDCKVTKQNGFTNEEIFQLEQYLTQSKDDIMQKAKVISNPLNWL